MSRRSPHLTSGVAALTVLAGLVAASPEAGAAGETCNGQVATVVGAGSITGTPGRDIIVGSSGDDSIDAGGGNDLVCAGAGDDTVLDGLGKDIVYLGTGDDEVIADPTKDVGDAVHGDAGSDTMSYELRPATVKVTLVNSGTADDGAAGEADKLTDVESAIGGYGKDTLVGTDGPNVLQGGSGNDTITDLGGADVVRGGDGDDKVAQPKYIDPGDDLEGGAGTDEISYAARTPDQGEVAIDLASTAAVNGSTLSGGEHDVVQGFENARGGLGVNRIDGTDGPNVIVMGAQGGHVHALGGNDTVTGGAGPETVDDGLGADVVKLGGGCDVMEQPVFSAQDVLEGGPATCDSIVYDQRTEPLTINLDPNKPAIKSGERDETDVLHGFERAYGGMSHDIIRGTDGANILDAGPDPVAFDGNDYLLGLGGPDLLYAHDGEHFNDAVDGGLGNDYAEIDTGDGNWSVERVYPYF